MASFTVLGIDPGLVRTGWGIVICQGNRFYFGDAGIITTSSKQAIAHRLLKIGQGIASIIETHTPNFFSIEKTFVNNNPTSSMTLGYARAVALYNAAQNNLPIFEYAPNMVKKVVTGFGHADKQQMEFMVTRLLTGFQKTGLTADAYDALAIALCCGFEQKNPVKSVLTS